MKRVYGLVPLCNVDKLPCSCQSLDGYLEDDCKTCSRKQVVLEPGKHCPYSKIKCSITKEEDICKNCLYYNNGIERINVFKYWLKTLMLCSVVRVTMYFFILLLCMVIANAFVTAIVWVFGYDFLHILLNNDIVFIADLVLFGIPISALSLFISVGIRDCVLDINESI